jgi:hypothetical protein
LENIPTGTTTVNFFAEPDALHASSTVFDALTNVTTITNYIKSAPVTVEVYVSEADAPDITVTDPAECENSLLADACLITTTDVEMSWNSSSDKLDHYTVVINGEAEDTTATSSVLALDDNMENTVEIFAVDTEGDTSDSIIYQIIVYSHPVVINEVAWMGTQAFYMDEWMELYNNTPYDIDLSDWKLVTQDGGIDINLQNTITGEGFYLLERTDDTTVNDVTADLIYTGDLNNNGEILILTHASSTIDQTPSDPVYWVAGDNGQRTTMERTDANLPGDMESSWHSNSANARNGRDAHFNPIKGTPRATNSYYEEIIVPM